VDNLKTQMFIGEYKHNLDTKSRLAIPAKFRNQLSSGAIITRGLDRCLFVFTSEDWDILAQKLVALPLTQADSRAFVRLMLAGAAECDFDSQGRVLIPDYLRKYAELEKETVVTGLYNRIEIWDSEVWSSYKKKTEGASEEIAEHLRDLGI